MIFLTTIGPVATFYTLCTVTTPSLYTSRIMWESIWPWGEREGGRGGRRGGERKRERQRIKEKKKKGVCVKEIGGKLTVRKTTKRE